MHPRSHFRLRRFASTGDAGMSRLLNAENIAIVMNHADHTIAKAHLTFDWMIDEPPVDGVTQKNLRQWCSWKNEQMRPRPPVPLADFYTDIFGLHWEGII